MANPEPIYKRLQGRSLFKSADLSAPLAEQTPNVVQFELSTGCSYNGCSYCDLFKGEKHSTRNTYQFRDHVQEVLLTLEAKGELGQLERVFIGNGDALSVPSRELGINIDTAIREFRRFTRKNPKRVAMYASMKNILTKSADELAELFCGGTCFWGCSYQRHGDRISIPRHGNRK